MPANRVVVPLIALIGAGCSVPLAPQGADVDAARGGACVDRAILGLVNAPTTTSEVLVGIGVYVRGADGIVAIRDGADGLPGSADDALFSTVAAVDAVPQVGTSSMNALFAFGDTQCAAEVVFSPQPYDTSHLARTVELLDGALRNVDVAIYSFSDSAVRDALARAVDRGVAVRVVYESAHEHADDPEGTWSASLEDRGIEVRWVNKIMHHKFAIVDGPRASLDEAGTAWLYDSSGNWSLSAGTKYDENSVFLQGDPKLVLQFQREFELLWENGRPLVWNEAIRAVPAAPAITDDDVALAEGSEAVFTSANFRTYASSDGPTFARDGDRATVVSRLVELIAGAGESIWIASGHFRSRPIAEAVRDAALANPELDVRVYLDQQEFTSEWTFADEEEDHAACVAAGDDDCEEIGEHFGYLLVEAGVPVRYKTYSYRWNYATALQMHDKYLVVDGETVATGSYNYSFNAEYDTLENVVVYERERYPELVDAYLGNHALLWETGRAAGLYESLVDEIVNGTGTVPLVYAPMALSWAEVDALKDAVQAACVDESTASTACARPQ